MATFQLHPDDTLRFAENDSIQKILSEQGDKSDNEEKTEEVLLSVHIIKINKRQKEQERILLLTNTALYNIRASNQWQPKSTPTPLTYTCRRRVHLSLIESISIPSSVSVSDEFIVHIPSEYDYRFKSNWHLHIANTIAHQSSIIRGKPVKVKRLEIDVDTEQAVISKKKSKRMSEVMQRKMLLQSQQASITAADAFMYHQGDVFGGDTIDSMDTTVAKAKSYALKLDECAGFCFMDKEEVEETENIKYKMLFKKGPVQEVGIDDLGYWHSFVVSHDQQQNEINHMDADGGEELLDDEKEEEK